MTIDNSRAKILIKNILSEIQELKGEAIVVLDFENIENTSFDWFIICEGSSNIHVRAIANKVEKQVRKHLSERPISTEGIENSEWVLMDYVNIVLHIFQSPIRKLYNLESLWGDAKQVDINKF